MLELHCMCRGENLFPWKLAKGQERRTFALLPLNADGSQNEDGAHFSLSALPLHILYTHPLIPPPDSFLFIFLSYTFRLSFPKSHLVAFLFLVSRGEKQVTEMGQMGEQLLISR